MQQFKKTPIGVKCEVYFTKRGRQLVLYSIRPLEDRCCLISRESSVFFQMFIELCSLLRRSNLGQSVTCCHASYKDMTRQ